MLFWGKLGGVMNVFISCLQKSPGSTKNVPCLCSRLTYIRFSWNSVSLHCVREFQPWLPGSFFLEVRCISPAQRLPSWRCHRMSLLTSRNPWAWRHGWGHAALDTAQRLQSIWTQCERGNLQQQFASLSPLSYLASPMYSITFFISRVLWCLCQ